MLSQTIAPYVLRTLAGYHFDGRSADLDMLVRDIGVRRADVRRTITALHHEGFVDAYRMRLTMAGFALGTVFMEINLPPLRSKTASSAAA